MKKIIIVGIMILVLSATALAIMPLQNIFHLGASVDGNQDGKVDKVDTALISSPGGIQYEDCNLTTGVGEKLYCDNPELNFDGCYTKQKQADKTLVCADFCFWVKDDKCLSCDENDVLMKAELIDSSSSSTKKKWLLEITCCPGSVPKGIENTKESVWVVHWDRNGATYDGKTDCLQ